MGFIDSVMRTLALTRDAEPPRYSPPPRNAADPHMGETNADTSVSWLRKFTTDNGPARTAPPTGTPADTRPVNSADTRIQAAIDRRGKSNYPRTDGSGTLNYSGTTPSTARPMPYGLQRDAHATQRPGASMNRKPSPIAGDEEDGQ
jgi:hypothetical protein